MAEIFSLRRCAANLVHGQYLLEHDIVTEFSAGYWYRGPGTRPGRRANDQGG